MKESTSRAEKGEDTRVRTGQEGWAPYDMGAGFNLLRNGAGRNDSSGLSPEELPAKACVCFPGLFESCRE